MSYIRTSVGNNSVNDKGDAAVVQACLTILTDSKGKAYLNSAVDGVFGPVSKAALMKYQADNGADAPRSPLGSMSPQGKTIKAMKQALKLIDGTILRSLPGTPIAYKESKWSEISQSIAYIDNKDFEANFKLKIMLLVYKMYWLHRVALKVPETGHFRRFQGQAKLSRSSTKAGPGESVHQYGYGVDIGFHGLVFMKTSGKNGFATDTAWLHGIVAKNSTAANQFWSIRNDVAKPIGLHPLGKNSWDLIHLEHFAAGTINMSASLSQHLNNQGAWKWKTTGYDGRYNTYSCDLGGLNNHFVTIGNTRQIWARNASITAAEIAQTGWVRPVSLQQAAQPPAPGGVAPTAALPNAAPPAQPQAASLPITAADIQYVKDELKAVLERADTDRLNWTPIPKTTP